MSGTQNPPVPQNKGLDPSPDRPRKTTSPANASVNMDELTELAGQLQLRNEAALPNTKPPGVVRSVYRPPQRVRAEVTVSTRQAISFPGPVVDVPASHFDGRERFPLLFVLDLNGTLLHRRNNGVHPRPFVKEFLTYLLENFYVLIWSSAQKHNVDRMIGRLLGEHQRHLVGRWHRDYCDLVRPKSHGGNTNQAFLTSREAAAARYKPLALKDLDKIWKTHKLRTAQAPPSTLRRNGTHRHQPQPIWMMEDALLEAIDARTHQILRWHRGNTLIVDDSADKVRYHGSNHIAIEDFEANPNPYDNDLEALLSYVKKLHASEHAKAGADIAQFDITDYLQRNPWTEFRAGVPRRVNRG